MEDKIKGSIDKGVLANPQIIEIFKELVTNVLARVGGLQYNFVEQLENAFENVKTAVQRQHLLDRVTDRVPFSVKMYENLIKVKGIEKIQDLVCPGNVENSDVENDLPEKFYICISAYLHNCVLSLVISCTM